MVSTFVSFTDQGDFVMTIKHRFSRASRVQQSNSEPSMTKQSFKQESDINFITSRYLKTGILPNLSQNPVYADITSVDFLDMQNLIADVRSEFDELPAKIRRKFDNDPYQMLRWLDDPENRESAIKLGIVSVEPPKAAPSAPPASPAPPAPPEPSESSEPPQTPSKKASK